MLSEKVDIVIVVGSKNSSNSTKLRHVAEEMEGRRAGFDLRDIFDFEATPLDQRRAVMRHGGLKPAVHFRGAHTAVPHLMRGKAGVKQCIEPCFFDGRAKDSWIEI